MARKTKLSGAARRKGQQKPGSRTDRLVGKQARFIEEYLIDRNAKQAAIRAGYSPRSAEDMGRRNLQVPKVAAAVAVASAKVSEKLQLTAEWVLAKLVENVDAARLSGDFTASNKACELLGKHLALFPDKVLVDYREVASLSDEELDDRRRKLRLVS